MLVAEKPIELSWVSVRDRLPFDGNWEIQDQSMVSFDVRAWLKLPSTPGNI
jgi:hypothetical protein